MSKIKLKKSDLLNVLILSAVGIILTVLGILIVGNQPEVFNDFIAETVAYFSMNMSGEIKVFWIVLIVCVPLLLWLNTRLKRFDHDNKDGETDKMPFALKAEIVLAIANLVYILVRGEFQMATTMAMIAVFLNYLVNKEKQKDGLILNIITYLALYGGATALNYVGFKASVSGVLLMIVTIIMDLILLTIDKKHNILNKAMLILQMIVPFGLLAYICERYAIGEAILKVGWTTPVYVVFAVAIIAMLGWNLWVLIKNWKNSEKIQLGKIVMLPTILVGFMLFSVGNGCGALLPLDLHHSGENVLSYQQIIGKGQEPYVDYSPVSGLFPVFIGGMLEMFGGQMTEYGIAVAVFMMLMAGITIWLTTKYLDKDDSLILSLLFAFVTYNRAVWVAMTLLILFLPKLLKNKNLWLKVWVWIILLQGLYYPSFGGAMLIGTLPLGIWQIVQMVKSGELKKRLKDWKFYLGWGVCLAPVVACIPLLLRLAKHVALYAKQTTLADGMAVFGQNVPDWVFPYLDSGPLMFVRQSVYYALRYVIPMIAVWLLIVVLIKYWKKRKEKSQMVPILMIVSVLVFLVVAYSGTIVRQDFDEIVSRPRYLIIPLVGMFFYIFLKKYVADNICKYILIGVIVGVALFLGCSPLNKLEDTTRYSVKVPEGYVQISTELKEKYPKLGDGFIHQSNLDMLESYGKRAKELLAYDGSLKFLGWGSLGIYYILDIPTVGQPSLYAAKDYETNKEVVDAIKAQRPVIGQYIPNISPGTLMSYYIYNYVYTADDYVYDDEYEAFLPIELFKKIHGEDAKPTPKDKAELRTTHASRVASSFGSSIKSLEKVMTEREIEEKIGEGKLDTEKKTYTIEVELPEKVKGEDADMVFFDFDVDGWVHRPANEGFLGNLTKQYYNNDIFVIVKWGDEGKDAITSELARGDLLVPMGANSGWLVNDHDKITIVIQNVDQEIKLNDVKFYQLRKQ